jgi:hypothetical protein
MMMMMTFASGWQTLIQPGGGTRDCRADTSGRTDGRRTGVCGALFSFVTTKPVLAVVERVAAGSRNGGVART